MTLPASIRVNVRAPFPARVQGAAFIQVNKANGLWTVAPNYNSLNPVFTISPTQVLALQDTVTGAFSVIGAQSFAAGLNTYRIITAAGVVTVLPTDIVLLLQKSPSGTSTVNLPAAATRGGVPVFVKDLTGDANTNNDTIVPNGAETIDGLSSTVINIAYGHKSLYPITGGWYVL